MESALVDPAEGFNDQEVPQMDDKQYQENFRKTFITDN